MNTSRARKLLGGASFAAGALLVGVSFLAGQVPEAPNEGAPKDEAGDDTNYRVVTRGPVHEAFAKNIDTDPAAGVVIPKAAPGSIEESPPDEVPEGDNVAWIPGYWGWDPDQNDFLWISGLWRDVPPGQRWVPGYWTKVDTGFQWVSGFWTSAEMTEVAYLDDPPQSLEEGPNVEAPSGDYFWIPGVWVWADTDYQWQPGYWSRAYADWVWMPAHYSWTPYGSVFVAGYWDYPLTDRGVLFAPVAFQTPVYTQPAFVYTPTVVLDAPGLLMHLFVAPNYHHYYFGDYYAYTGDFGITPWYTLDTRAAYYDPMLTYYQWSYGRRGIDFADRLRSWNDYFVANPDFRPRHTWREQRDFFRTNRDNPDFRVESFAFAHSLTDQRADDRNDRPFRRLDESQRKEWRDMARTFRDVQSRRGETERGAAASDTAQRRQGGKSGRLQLPELAGRLREGAQRRGFRPGDDTNATKGRGEPGRDAAVPSREPAPANVDGGKKAQDGDQRGRPQEGDQRERFRRPPETPRNVLGDDQKNPSVVPPPGRDREPNAPAGRPGRNQPPRGAEGKPQPRPERDNRPKSTPGRTPEGRNNPGDATPRPTLPGLTPGDTPNRRGQGGDRGREQPPQFPRFRFQQQPQESASPAGRPGALQPGQAGPGRSGGQGRGVRRIDPVDQTPPRLQQGPQQGRGAGPGNGPAVSPGRQDRPAAPGGRQGAGPSDRKPSPGPAGKKRE